MAIEVILEKESGSMDAATLPYVARDDGDPPADVAIDDAIAAVVAIAPPTFLGVPFKDYQWQRLANSAVSVRMNYGDDLEQLSPLAVGQTRYSFNLRAQPFYLDHSIALIGKYPSGTAPNTGGLINAWPVGGMNYVSRGMWVPTPRENLGKNAAVSLLTAASLYATAKSLIGCVNSAVVGSYSVGELMLTSVIGQQRDDESFSMDVGWSYKENVTGLSIGSIAGISHKGHEYVWTIPKWRIDSGKTIIYPEPLYAFVEQIHPTANLNALGIIP